MERLAAIDAGYRHLVTTLTGEGILTSSIPVQDAASAPLPEYRS
jgi:hypothetical protein